jgi:hypothetical protein
VLVWLTTRTGKRVCFTNTEDKTELNFPGVARFGHSFGMGKEYETTNIQHKHKTTKKSNAF